MVQRVVSRINKISILIVAFMLINFFIVVFSNMIIDGKDFVIKDGEYSYDELFYSQNSGTDYYIFSRSYYEDNPDNKYISGDDIFEKLKFTAVDEFKAMTILSFANKESILGYLKLSCINMTDKEVQEVYERKDFVYLGYVYKVLGKSYLYVFFKDYIYTKDSNWSEEDNFYLATKTYNSNSVAVFEVENLDLSVIQLGEKQNTSYRKSFLSIFDNPYRYIIIFVCLVETLILFVIKKRTQGDDSSKTRVVSPS